MKAITTIALLLCIALSGSAQTFFASNAPDTIIKARRSEVATQIAVGGANLLDTYLSQQKYRGTELRFISEVMRDSRRVPLTYVLAHEGAVSQTHNRSNNANDLSGHYDFAYAALYRWSLLDGNLTLRVGAMSDILVGFSYNTHNTANNPAQARLSLGIGPMAAAHCRFTLWGKPFRAIYTMRMPWLGAMFSPNYGQSYYEIFATDDYDHNLVITSFATFQMRQHLALDMQLGRNTAIRLGYISDIRQAKPNNLKQHHYFNAVTVGVVVRK